MCRPGTSEAPLWSFTGLAICFAARSFWQGSCESLWPEDNVPTGVPYHHLPGGLLCFWEFWRSQRKDEVSLFFLHTEKIKKFFFSFFFSWLCFCPLAISYTNEGRSHILLGLFVLQGFCKVNYPSLLSLLQSLHTECGDSERHQKYWERGAGSPQRFEHRVWCLEQNEPVSGDLMPRTSVVASMILWVLAVNVI